MTAGREQAWQALKARSPFDLLVIGGGITGAGVLHEAARRGLSAVLVEQGDFASGASSRSSKLVHGGLRYLAQGDLRLTWHAVHERERLLEELPGLVEPLGFLMASYQGDRVGPRLLRVGLELYDLFGATVKHRALSRVDLSLLAPRLKLERLTGAFWFRDAQTCDARLVLRVLFDALGLGALALNYARAEELTFDGERVSGAVVRDRETGRAARLKARAVVNATGAWVDALRSAVGGEKALRPLRGSHLLFPAWRFPVAQAVTFRQSGDGRPVFAYPWEGRTLLGTTDVDHQASLDEAPRISAGETQGLLEAARGAFPGLALSEADAVSSYAGVRPVIGSGPVDPSRESREHAVWHERGLLTVAGGKLTTFRHIAREALAALARLGIGEAKALPRGTLSAAAQLDTRLGEPSRRRLAGRYGPLADRVVGAARAGELEQVPDTSYLWAELRHAAGHEQVVHLDDLLLRRVRLGLLLPEGAREHLPRVRAICQAELGWADQRWADEEQRYLDTWRHQHRPT